MEDKATELLIKCEKFAKYLCVDNHSSGIACNSKRIPNAFNNGVANYEWQASSSVYADEKRSSYIIASGNSPEEALKYLLTKLKFLSADKSKRMMAEAQSMQDFIDDDL